MAPFSIRNVGRDIIGVLSMLSGIASVAVAGKDRLNVCDDTSRIEFAEIERVMNDAGVVWSTN